MGQLKQVFSIVLLILLMIPGLILLNWFLFQKLFGVNYFIWYIKNGFIISALLGIFAVNLEELEETKGLLSLDPISYFESCFKLAGIFSLSLAGIRRPKKDMKVSRFALYWDESILTILNLILLVGIFAWVFIISPLNYLVTLISGAPARWNLRGLFKRTVVKRTDTESTIVIGQTKVVELIQEVEPLQEVEPFELDKSAKKSIDVTFAGRPFATTQALTAMILWVVKSWLGV